MVACGYTRVIGRREVQAFAADRSVTPWAYFQAAEAWVASLGVRGACLACGGPLDLVWRNEYADRGPGDWRSPPVVAWEAHQICWGGVERAEGVW